MIFTPRPWQQPMIEFMLKNRRVNLWADMGSGKTSAVMTVLQILEMCGSNFFPVLIIGPKRVARDVWPSETQKWDHTKHMRVVPILGTETERRRALHTKADVYCINYDNLEWLVEQTEKQWPFLTVIADESTRLKGFRLRAGGKRTAALARVARKTHRWVNLTGTPSPNGLRDLWGQAWFLDFGERLGLSWTAFNERWFRTNQYTREVEPQPFAQDQIQKALQDITLTIQMKDYVDLKEPIVRTVYVDLSPENRRQYKKLEKEMFVQLSENIELIAMTGAAKTTKCLQFCSGAVYYGEDKQVAHVHDEKLDALESIVEESAGANLLVSYWWKHDLDRIKKRFPHARQLLTKKDEDDWNAGKIRMLLAQPQSAGHGLNLQFGGSRIAFFSDFWNLELRQQIIERLGPVRQLQAGFDRPVYIYQIIARNTIDELVLQRHESKATVQELLMSAMKKQGGSDALH